MLLVLFWKVVLFISFAQSQFGNTNPNVTKITHKINTTKCSWKPRSVPLFYGNLTMHQFQETSFNHGPHVYGVCTFTLWEPLNITSFSAVDIVGRHSLLIRSNESIFISAPLILSWSPARNRSDMWLGGFCSRDDGWNRTNGYGPGGGSCYGSAGHGGMGIRFKRGDCGMKYGWRYPFNLSNLALIGGSSGGVVKLGSGLSCGGGALMIFSEISITIDAKISTNAYNLLTNDSCISGASGGRIMIKAPKVKLTRNASLVSRGTPENLKGDCSAYSGSGGVIVINGTIDGDLPDPHNNTGPQPEGVGKKSYGEVIINGVSKNRLPSLYTSPEGYEGCYSKTNVKAFAYSIFEDYLVRPFDCKKGCKACGYRYAVLHVKLCTCVNALSEMTKVSDTKCSLRCFGREQIRCGGRNTTNIFYVVYGTNTTASNSVSNISTPKSCPRNARHSYCNSRPRTNLTSATVAPTTATSTTKNSTAETSRTVTSTTTSPARMHSTPIIPTSVISTTVTSIQLTSATVAPTTATPTTKHSATGTSRTVTSTTTSPTRMHSTPIIPTSVISTTVTSIQLTPATVAPTTATPAIKHSATVTSRTVTSTTISRTRMSGTTMYPTSVILTTDTHTTQTLPATSTRGHDKTSKLKNLFLGPITKNNSARILKELSKITTAIDPLSAYDLNLSLSILEKIVQEDAICSKNKTECKHVGQLVLNIAENLLNNSLSSWSSLIKEEKRRPEILLQLVEQTATSLGNSLDTNETLQLNSDNFGLRIELIDSAQFEDRTYVFTAGLDIIKKKSGFENDRDEIVFLPASLSEAINGSGLFRLNLLKYRPHSSVVNASLKNSTSRLVLASNIIAISLSRPLKQELDDNVVINFPLSQVSTKRSCRFLDFRKIFDISWSTRGCVARRNKERQIECVCNHFTNFAVLMDVEQVPIDEVHVEALSWITYLGCTASLVCLVATLTTFAVLKRFVCDHTWIHCNLIASLTLAQFVFIVGIKATDTKIVCRAIAIILHYLYTTAIFWMCVEGIHLYRKVVKVFIQSSVKKSYYIFGWGGPAVVVLISALWRFDGFGSEKACWLSVEKGLIWAFVVPVLALFLVNLIILLEVIHIMLVAANTVPPSGQNSSVRNGVKGVIFLLPILGLTWVFGVLAVNSSTVVFQYIFTLLNSLQGFFIFLFHCVFNKDVRAAVKKRQQRKNTVQRRSNDSSWKSKDQICPKGGLQPVESPVLLSRKST